MTNQCTPTGDYEAYEAVGAPDGAGRELVPAPVPAATDIAAHLDALRIAVGKTEALAAVAVESYDRADWSGADPLQVERMAYLLGAIAEAAADGVGAAHRIHAAIADWQLTETCDEW
jgi:hypothetical protein